MLALSVGVSLVNEEVPCIFSYAFKRLFIYFNMSITEAGRGKDTGSLLSSGYHSAGELNLGPSSCKLECVFA